MPRAPDHDSSSNDALDAARGPVCDAGRVVVLTGAGPAVTVPAVVGHADGGAP